MQVFTTKNVEPEKGFSLLDNRNLKPQSGDIGIEIEVEGKRIPGCGISGSVIPSVWGYHPDGSLRGEENGEYVLRKPIPFDEVPSALGSLWLAFENSKTVLDDSNRTSVHIHLNVQQFYTNRLISLMALYIVFEEILTAWCGEHRVGNLFCLRVKDAPAILRAIRYLAKNDFSTQIADGLHYSGMNVNALAKYGSLEFRTLRGTKDPKVIMAWVKILRRLYDLSAEFKDPREIMYSFSANGPLGFFSSILGDCEELVTNDLQFTEDQIKDSMYEGVRLAQDICFCRDWSMFEEVKLKPDPFGRSKKKVLQSMSVYENSTVFMNSQAPIDEFLSAPVSINPPPLPSTLSSLTITTDPLHEESEEGGIEEEWNFPPEEDEDDF